MGHNVNCIHVIKELSSDSCTHPSRNPNKGWAKKVFKFIHHVVCTEPFSRCELQEPHKMPNRIPPPHPPKKGICK